jgi:hypothetical protein
MSPLIDDEERETDSLAVGEEVEKAESKAGDESSEEESDSDEEDGETENRNGKISVKDLLEKVLKAIKNGDKDLTNSSQLKAFKAGDGNLLASNTGDLRQPTALHIMAAMDKKELPKLDSKMEPLIKHLVEHENDILSSLDRSGHTPLFLAIEAKKEKMVQWMCDSHPNISAILAITSNDKDKMNCLHIGIDKRVKFLDLLIEKADPDTLAAKDGDGNTPLHLAVEYKKCKREQLDIIQKIIAKSDIVVQHNQNGDFNDNGLSPYLHHKENVRKAQAREKEKEKKKLKEEKERDKGNSRVRPDGVEVDSSPQNSAPRSQEPSGPGGPANPSGQATDPSSRPDKRPTVQIDSRNKYGGRTQPPAMNVSSPATGTAPPLVTRDDLRKAALHVPDSGTRQASDTRSVDETVLKDVERLLKVHYLRSRSYNEAMEILYGRNTTSGKRNRPHSSGVFWVGEQVSELTTLL